MNRTIAARHVVLGALLGLCLSWTDANASVLLSGNPNATYSASSSWSWQTPDMAFDGNPATPWNAGHGPPAWLQVDLGSAYALTKFDFVVNQLPVVGYTTHDLFVDGVLVHTFSGTTFNTQMLEWIPSSPIPGETVRIETTFSPSWVAWYEAEVFGEVVPEATSLLVWALLGALGLGLGWWRRRKPAA